MPFTIQPIPYEIKVLADSRATVNHALKVLSDLERREDAVQAEVDKARENLIEAALEIDEKIKMLCRLKGYDPALIEAIIDERVQDRQDQEHDLNSGPR